MVQRHQLSQILSLMFEGAILARHTIQIPSRDIGLQPIILSKARPLRPASIHLTRSTRASHDRIRHRKTLEKIVLQIAILTGGERRDRRRQLPNQGGITICQNNRRQLLIRRKRRLITQSHRKTSKNQKRKKPKPGILKGLVPSVGEWGQSPASRPPRRPLRRQTTRRQHPRRAGVVGHGGVGPLTAREGAAEEEPEG